ncbi:hypothetical protein KSP40_PGU022413 [Platanthera guangdongensis]|uniref:Uncharacterized protein n=1 Tax=Platanthera guangdongensis TaxID=2320717 RepID=A0ABR2N5L3_9ASPA
MSCGQNFLSPSASLGIPAIRLRRTCSLSQFSFLQMSALCTSPTQTLQHHKILWMVHSSSKNKAFDPICLFGGKGNSRGKYKLFLDHKHFAVYEPSLAYYIIFRTGPGFSWESVKDAVKGLGQKNIVQDILRDQIRRREFGGDAGDGNPPGRPGGGGGADGTDGEGSDGILDETLQVFLATIAFILVYIYIIRGAELTMLTRDYFKYCLGGVPSMRLQRIINKWRRVCDELTWTEEPEDWLERAIVTTPTWWHRPEKIVRAVKSKRRRRDP